jgi:hypothetical protein
MRRTRIKKHEENDPQLTAVDWSDRKESVEV